MKNKLGTTLYEIHHMDALARRPQWVNRIHPLVKLFLTLYYITLVVSFHKYDVIGLAGMIIYPLVLFLITEQSFWDAVKRMRLVLPLVLLIGIANPFLDHNQIVLGNLTVSAGVLSFLTLVMKGFFSIFASYLLISTTTMEGICYALRLVHVPKLLVTQFMLTYRYMSVLFEEANRTIQAYELRAPKQKGIHYKVWGSLTGLLLLRSIDRANVVFESMTLRGYQGEYQYLHQEIKASFKDFAYLLFWAVLLALFRIIPVFTLIGGLFV